MTLMSFVNNRNNTDMRYGSRLPAPDQRTRLYRLHNVVDLGCSRTCPLGGGRHSKGTWVRLESVDGPVTRMLTGVDGGMVRDLLLNEIPTVLGSALYAVAVLAGMSVVVTGHLLSLPPTAMAIRGAAFWFGIRSVAIRRGWRLPPRNCPNGRARTCWIVSRRSTQIWKHLVTEAPNPDGQRYGIQLAA